MSNDANRFPEAAWCMQQVMVPVYLSVALALLIINLGVAALSGIVVLIISLAINGRMMKRLHHLRTTQLGKTDDRVKQTNEAVLGVRVVKLYTWEAPIQARVEKLRAVELRRLKAAERLMAVNRFMFFSIPVLTAVITFLVFTALGNKMDASLIFSSMALLNLIQEYFQRMPEAVALITQVLVAQKRIGKFLAAEELSVPPEDVRTATLPPVGFGSVVLRGVSVQWQQPEQNSSAPVLSGLNLAARDGQLVAVFGAVGSGKSTVLAAILGEMHQTAGRTELRGSVGYCAQQPWLVSGTLRENILYGRPFLQAEWEQTLAVCGLLPDLEQLPAGDQTVIGERGINISGGQKARIALARAVYRRPDIFLMDDVLAAVDPHVGEHLMAECICGAMAGRTRVLVTNALHFLPRCDRIYVVHGGTIAEDGTYDELISAPESLLVRMG
eukprot:SAG22_NODE_1727_length_3711_cov_8.805925_1_plen_441_part_10